MTKPIEIMARPPVDFKTIVMSKLKTLQRTFKDELVNYNPCCQSKTMDAFKRGQLAAVEQLLREWDHD